MTIMLSCQTFYLCDFASEDGFEFKEKAGRKVDLR